jgi:hypothetical protein
MAQWRLAAASLEQIKLEELRALSEAEAARIVNEILPEVDYSRRSGMTEMPTGLIEQQRLFALASHRS